jgi:hypothetical protein
LDSGTHEYSTENLACSWGQSNCSVDAVAQAIKTRGGAVPCLAVNCGGLAGSWSNIGLVNFVTHVELSDGIMNVTTPVHLLNGVVQRFAVPTDQGVAIRTMGFGVGPMSTLNSNFFGKVWNYVDRGIQKQFR